MKVLGFILLAIIIQGCGKSSSSGPVASTEKIIPVFKFNFQPTENKEEELGSIGILIEFMHFRDGELKATALKSASFILNGAQTTFQQSLSTEGGSSYSYSFPVKTEEELEKSYQLTYVMDGIRQIQEFKIPAAVDAASLSGETVTLTSNLLLGWQVNDPLEMEKLTIQISKVGSPEKLYERSVYFAHPTAKGQEFIDKEIINSLGIGKLQVRTCRHHSTSANPGQINFKIIESISCGPIQKIEVI